MTAENELAVDVVGAFAAQESGNGRGHRNPQGGEAGPGYPV